MSTSFVSHAILLKKLFDRRFSYTIPIYQRAFSWSNDQSTKLFEDIVEAMGEEHEQNQIESFFLGALILTGNMAETAKRPLAGKLAAAFTSIISGQAGLPDNIKGDFDVVDGKQRLVTLTILLCLLRDLSSSGDLPSLKNLIGDGRDNNQYRLDLCGGEGAFLHKHVLTLGSSINPVPDLDNISTGEENMIKVRDSLHRNLLDLSATDRTRLLGYIVDHCQVVIILSEKIDHAFQIFLSINDSGTKLTEGDILKVELMASLSAEYVEKYRPIWEQWNDSLGTMRSKASSQKKTFFNHFRFVLTSDHVNLLADFRKMIDEAGGAIPFIENHIIPNVDAYNIINEANWPDQENKHELDRIFGTLNWLPHDDWIAPAMLAITRYRNDPAQALAFFKKLERLAYGLLVMKGGAPDRKKKYNPLKRALRDQQYGKDPFKVVELSAAEKRIVRNTIERNMHQTRPVAAKLLLLRLDMEETGRPVSYYNQLMETEALSVEHLLPLSPEQNSQWLANFPDEKLRKYNTQLFGNLFLVRKDSENRLMKNSDFPDKYAILFKNNADHPIHFTNTLKNMSDWSLNDIAERQDILLTMIDNLWK
ncbi:MAG: DUF262 domain-containing protein [bacterium]|nr:DUF262 domain-containing protein [bacterium]